MCAKGVPGPSLVVQTLSMRCCPLGQVQTATPATTVLVQLEVDGHTTPKHASARRQAHTGKLSSNEKRSSNEK